MQKDKFDKLFSNIIDQVKSTRDQGQKEYAHTITNVFANLERTGKQLNIGKEKVLMIFLLKHMDGIIAHINGHESQREDIRGRIKDAIVYLTLYWGMVEDKMGAEMGTNGGSSIFNSAKEEDMMLKDFGFTKTKNGSTFNPETGEVKYDVW